MPKTDAKELLVRKAAEAIHAADPSAFLVESRVVRRVIRAEYELTGLGMRIPHRKSYVIDADTLLEVVQRDELGLDRSSQVRSPAILIAQPGDERLATLSLSDLLLRSWSLLFHARIDATIAEKIQTRELTANMVRERIDRIGQVEFDEMHAVIRQEDFLLRPEDPMHIYTEAAAVFLELKYFRPQWLSAWFPCLDDWNRVEAIFAEDVDVQHWLESTRPEGAPQPGEQLSNRTTPRTREDAALPLSFEPTVTSKERLTRSAAEFAANGEQNSRAYNRFVTKANKAADRGNSAKAALLRLRAARHGRRESVGEASLGAERELDQLAARLQIALGFTELEANSWREVLSALAANATSGFWNADKRVLYDLQKVCIDHERQVSKVDLLSWMKSFGKQPVRRKLPNQREVLMSKHLRQATSRLAAVRLPREDREKLSKLLHKATEAAESQLRERLGPLVTQALDDVGICPRNLPERISREKLINELLDKVVHHGFLNMSMLRDALSRNNLKMPDLSGPKELWKGDWLLQADRRLNELLDGVYRRGEIYLRGLQKVSSLAFGTPPGRFLTKYVAIPFGGGLIILEGMKHLFDKFAGVDTHAVPVEGAELGEHPTHLLSWFDSHHHPAGFWTGIAVMGFFLMGLIHVPKFRAVVVDLLLTVWQLLRIGVVEFPKWIWRVSSLRFLLKSRVAKMFREWVFYPLIITALVWLIFPVITPLERMHIGWAALLFAVLTIALNSRVGRDFEELATERAHDTWRRVRAHVFVALFESIMNFFKRVLETVERVLYAVDEWLRFKSGENTLTMWIKGVAAFLWAGVAYALRFVINLLVEPQINPIKHFPVVTVSHKIILPLGFTSDPKTTLSPLASIIAPLVDDISTANAIAAGVVFLIPGVFGFLVWECKENWRLYTANRSRKLKPVVVGSHGESMIRLMKPGFHSGTIPKLFRKLRLAERHHNPERRVRNRVRYHEKLHHVVVEVRHFVDRELIQLLSESKEIQHLTIHTGQIRVASNSICVELLCPQLSELSLVVAFQEQSSYLMAGTLRPGWTVALNEAEKKSLWLALAGFYKMAGVDVVREQLQSCFVGGMPPYDMTDRGLVIWPGGDYQDEVRYEMTQRPTMRPRPRTLAKQHAMPTMEAPQAIYAENSIQWDDWVAAWDAEQEAKTGPALFPSEVRLLPAIPTSNLN